MKVAAPFVAISVVISWLTECSSICRTEGWLTKPGIRCLAVRV